MTNRSIFLILLLFSTVSYSQNNSSPRLLVDGKTWEYLLVHTYIDFSDVKQKVDSIYVRVWIDGDSIVDAQTYHRMRISRSDGATAPDELWRENDGKVFLLNRLNGKEELMYDFTLKAGDRFSMQGINNLTVKSNDEVLVNDVIRKRITIAQSEVFPWVEGVGNAGLLTEPLGSPFGNGMAWHLLSCVENGEVIFGEKDFYAPAYDGSITDSTHDVAAPVREKGDDIFHDLQGRRLNGIPQKGVYIQNGRKMVK